MVIKRVIIEEEYHGSWPASDLRRSTPRSRSHRNADSPT